MTEKIEKEILQIKEENKKKGKYMQLKRHKTQEKIENEKIHEIYKVFRKNEDFVENVQHCKNFMFDLITNNFDLEAELKRIKMNK